MIRILVDGFVVGRWWPLLKVFAGCYRAES